MSDLSNITVNGIPLKEVVDEQDRVEKRDFRAEELSRMSRTIKTHTATKNFRNTSGSRTSKGRVLVQNGVWL